MESEVKDEKTRVLFLCVHNSARSQIAEAHLLATAGGRFDVQSAGLKPKEINPLVIEVLREEGIDISGKKTHSAFEFYQQGRLYDYVITVCDEEIEAQCPVFPGITRRLHWPFPDPAAVTGTREEKLAKVRAIRDTIEAKIDQWADSLES